MIGVGALAAGAGAAIRASTPDGTSRNSGSHLLDVLGWLVVVAAAVLEATSANFFFQIEPRGARRRSVLLGSAGLIAALLGCYLASSVFEDSSPALLPAMANAVLVAGIGAGLAGFLSFGWHYGGGYAARRIEKLSDEDW